MKGHTANRKKAAIITLSVLLGLVILAGGAYLYISNNPSVQICRFAYTGTDGKSFDRFGVTTGTLFNIPASDSAQEKLRQLGDWNGAAVNDLTDNYCAPYNIEISGEINGGKTTLRYSGTATAKDGTTVEYNNEKVFDFAFANSLKLAEDE